MDLFNSTAFWKKDYWLPRADTWDDVPTKISDLWTGVYFALPIMILRLFWEAFVGLKLGKQLGYVNEPLAQAAFSHLFGGFARQTKRKKVLETFWRFSAYSFLFAFGCFVLSDKPWLYDTHQGFINYPRHEVDYDVRLYYMLEFGFYISLLVGSVVDVRRSDFWEMTVHHFVTLALLAFSWIINFARLGSLILLSHDLSDPFLEGAKLVRYTRKHTNLANGIFVVFLLCWTATRLVYFPFVLVLTGIRDGPALIQPDYEVFNFKQLPYAPRVLLILLCCLMVLHVFWTFLLVKIVARALRSGAAADVRSDSEESEELNDEPRRKVLQKRRELEKKHK
ncbi:TRAM LAG1 CLN8-like proteiny domain containing protein [Aphelenchoides fujianensis]|nr:TRAM LAG1 CLN8-like proteiny domain containing protein [Aphelenchoides fujianensis]